MVLPVGLKRGVTRPYRSTRVSAVSTEKSARSNLDNVLVYVLLIVGSIVRFHSITEPRAVVKVEAPIGQNIRSYMYGQFFVDTDPPLAKLVFFFCCLLFDWDGTFPFSQPGEQYPPSGGSSLVPFTQLRAISAIFGLLSIISTFFLLRTSGCRSIVAAFGLTLLLFETSFATHSKFFTIEPLFILGLSLAYWGHKRIQLAGNGSLYSKQWFKANLAVSLGIGIALSLAEIGMYSTAFFAVLATLDSWTLLGDLEVLDFKWWVQTMYRFWLYIVVPFIIYLAVFAVHFEVLYREGRGLGSVLPEFRVSSFEDAQNFVNMPSDVSYGATITLKHVEMNEYLHLHNFTYKGGLQGQQVTLFDLEDDLDNEWIIEMRQKTVEGGLQTKFRAIKDNSLVRLYHKRTGKYLTVKDVRPPISEHDYSNEVLVSGSREEDSDVNYEWKVRIVKKRNNLRFDLPLIKLLADQSVFQLIHQGTKCVLMSHKTKLPKYGHFQREVTCVNEPTIPNTLWYIEKNSHPVLNDDPKFERIPFKRFGFWAKFIDNFKAMRRVRANLSSGEVGGKPDGGSSAPETWPFNMKEDIYYQDEQGQVVLLGNSVVYWVGFFIITWVSSLQLFHLLHALNPYALIEENESCTRFYATSLELLLGWGFHLFPYFSLNGYFHLHNYLPLLYFAILTIARYVEFQFDVRCWWGITLAVTVTSGTLYMFYEASK